MAEILMVPIQLDALYLKRDRSVVETMADFSRLPYCDGNRDINPDVANLSEEILSQPFEDRGLQLKAGVHLHWALPDALTRGYQPRNASGNESERSIIFPRVPNRWLVTRTDAGGRRQWVVESDYLHPAGGNRQPNAISYPYASKSPPQPYRYLGRKLPLAEWKNKDATAQYLPPEEALTAVGYGEPTFAAFYPNCLSVFGFHDDAPPRSLQGVEYDVIGWYSDPQQDCLYAKGFQEAFGSRYPLGRLSTAEEKWDALKEIYEWVVEHPSGSPLPPFPDQTICCAHLTFEPDDRADDLPEKRKVAVAVGNTGTEALSAYLADFCARDPDLAKQIPNPDLLEDQLEAIHLASQFEGRMLDIGTKFREARHNKEFNGVMAGTLWTIRLEKTASGQANAHEAATYAEDTLPPELGAQLDWLNVCQQDFDRDCHEIESLRKQLFADWYKYMLCVYPPEGNRDQYPNHDEVKYIIEKNDLFPLQQRIAKNEELNVRRNEAFANLYQAVAELQLLGSTDITDWKKFQERFHVPRQDAPRSEQVEHVCKLLSNEAKTLLSTQTDPLNEENQKQVIRGLNGVLKDARFYESKVFEGIALSGEAQGLVAQLRLTNASIKDWPYDQLLRFNRLLLEAVFPEEITKNAPYALKSVPAPRYWQPNEPVVLIVDEVHQTAKPSPRHGEDGLLKCETKHLDGSIDQHLEDIRHKIIELRPGPKETPRTGFRIWKKQPWHPFLLEWEVEVMPLKGKYKRSRDDPDFPVGRAYDPGCIIQSYQLNEDDVDQVIRPGEEKLAKESNRYYGRSILTPYAKFQLIHQIERLLESLAKEKKDAFLGQILPIYKYLKDSGFHLLAQSLSGFNEALLMQKQTFQLPIHDPLGFADYQPFTEAVGKAVERSNRTAPQPHNDFNPIRTGVLKFNQLRLVDTFGQVQTLNLQDNQVITTDVMTTPANPHLVILPPRIVQPARLNFRWLAGDDDFALAESDDPEMNSHPVSTPICGWLVPNNLDNSLMVFDQQGRALGSLTQGARWEPAPGSQRSVVRWPLPNPHLQRVVSYLQEQSAEVIAMDEIQTGGDRYRFLRERGPDKFYIDTLTNKLVVVKNQKTEGFLDAFLNVIENALENIDPEYAGGHEALALLMGRPIAVARASLNLEVQGYPAIDQDWNVFRNDMERAFQHESKDRNRETEDYTEVEFPIRIGEYKQLNDGLVGYWIEEEGTLANTFYAPQTAAKLEIKAGPPPGFDLNESFTLAKKSNGINPVTQKVTLKIGTVSVTIPPGSFQQNPYGRFAFQGTINGLSLQVQIVPLGNNIFTIKAEGTGVDLTELTNPVTVVLTIGIDSGTTTLDAQSRLPSNIVVHRDDEPLNITQSINSPPHKLTLLLDPRGSVHATSGILPTKAIQIPADQFVEALRTIEVTFLSAPIMTDRGKINLPVPDEPGYVWSWCEKENGVWDKVTQIGQVTTEPTAAPQELREGWLKLTEKKQQLTDKKQQ
jgi:hypothetical protein